MSYSMFIDKQNWSKIERGYFFQAAMYYLSDTEQPLKFLTTDEKGNLIIEERFGDFDPEIVGTNKFAKEQDIVVTVKPRQVIVISDNKLNKSKQFEYVQVVPVLGISNRDTLKPWYNKLKKDNLVGFAFIPYGRLRIKVDLTQLSTIHKSMLLEKQKKVPDERMVFIESQILELLDL